MGGQFQDIPGYELVSELGEGGMATVYLAIQHSLDRKVAIKVMRRELRVSNGPMPEFERRFLLEGRTMAKLPHRNIVAVYDIVTSDEIAYISMELLEGGTLSDRMRNGLSLGEAIGVVVQLANGLEYAHRNGVIHRDLKPSNVMFRDPTTPVLTDFGIAKQSDVMASRITQTGLVLGTPTYMSPEQASGREIDGRSDQYSLGVLFYELLTGKPPFVGDTPIAVLMGHALQPPPPLPDELQALQPVFDRMLAKNPSDRFTNLQDFTRALRGLVVGNANLSTQLGNVTSASVSERLRALGFSGEYTGNDSDFALDLLRMPRTDPQISQRSTTLVPSVLRRPRVLALIAGVLGSIVLGSTLWITLRTHTLSEDEQYFVRTLLRQADGFIANGALLAPPGENAFEDLQKVQQKDPGNARAQELLGKIGTTLRSEAEKSLAAGDLAAATEHANQALLVVPDDSGVQQLTRHVGEERERRARAQRVGEYVHKAEEAERRRQRTGPDGAYALLQSALALAPDNTTVRQHLKTLTDAEFARVRELLAAGKTSEAAQALAGMRAEFGADSAYTALSAEIDRTREAGARTRQIADLLGRAQVALAAGRISEPSGDNAFELFEQARQIDADSATVATFRKSLADRTIADARAAQQRKQTENVLDHAELALRIDPSRKDAIALRDTAQSALGSQRAAIATQLSLARQSIAAGRLLPPAKDNARDVLDALLATDPQNADVRKLREALPQLVADALRAALGRDDLAAAGALATSAAADYPGDSQITAVIGDLRKRENQRKTEQLQREREQRIAVLLQKRPLNSVDALAAAREIVSLRESDSGAAANYEQKLVDVFGDDMRNAASVEAGEANLSAMRAAASAIATNKALGLIYADAEARMVTLQAQRATEIEAQKGQLVINALPWGYVDQVLDDARKPIALPEDRSTPLQLTLPSGSYYITLRHPKSAKTVSTFARVQAKQRTQTSGSFPTLSAEEYLKNAGL
jgi:serine/threonine protein kinase